MNSVVHQKVRIMLMEQQSSTHVEAPLSVIKQAPNDQSHLLELLHPVKKLATDIIFTAT